MKGNYAMSTSKKVSAPESAPIVVTVEATKAERAISLEGMTAQAEHRKGSDRLSAVIPSMVAMVTDRGYTIPTALLAPKIKGLKQSGKTEKSSLKTIEEWYTLQGIFSCGMSKFQQGLLAMQSDEGLRTEDRVLRTILWGDRQTLINNTRAYMVRKATPKKKGAQNTKADLKSFLLKNAKLCVARIQDNSGDDSVKDIIEIKEAFDKLVKLIRA
tara:strand:- start:77 stop:718 length:642 start_codon:yes stop_codon:yes gene_type:complete